MERQVRLTLLSMLAGWAWAHAAAGQPPGVLVEAVASGRAAAEAGVEPGDVLLSWSAADDGGGALRSVLDWSRVVQEAARRSRVRIGGRRGDRPVGFDLPPGSWGLTVRPRLREDAGSRFDEAASCAEARADGDVGTFGSLAESFRDEGDPVTAWWLYRRALQAAIDGRRFGDALHLRAAALQVAGEIPGAHAAATIQVQLGIMALRRDDQDAAIASLEEAVRLHADLGTEGMVFATCLRLVGYAWYRKGALEIADSRLDRADRLLARLAPASLARASALNNWGLVALARGELDLADERFRRALDLKEREHAAPGSLANTLDNMGLVAMRRGHHAAAEAAMTRALEIREKESPRSRSVAFSLNNLGVLASRRRDHEAALAFHARALAMKQALVPGSLDLASTLQNLGTAHFVLDELDEAERYHEAALAIIAEKAGGSLLEATSLENLGGIHVDRGRPDQAEPLLRRALAIRDEIAPGSLRSAVPRLSLGLALERAGSLAAAEASYREAVRIARAAVPESMVESDALGLLARLLARTDRREEAVGAYLEAMDLLEAQSGLLGGPQEVRSAFRAGTARIYHEATALLVDLGRREEAFDVLERSRARIFLEVLAEQDVRQAVVVPEGAERRLRELAGDHDRIREELAELSPVAEPERVAALLHELRELRRARALVVRLLRGSDPAGAALRAPSPLGVRQAADLLGADTRLLSYSVGETETRLFVLGADGLVDVSVIPAGEEEIRAAVQGMRQALERGRTGRHRPLLRARSRRLHELLLGPASEHLTGCRHLVIVPDGALHVLPFAALVGPDDRHLIESHSVRVVSSATVLGQLRRRAAPPGGTAGVPVLVALGSPEPAASVGAARPAPTQRGSSPLPGALEELESLGELFGSQAEVHVGADATEERVLAVGTGTRYLHLACHGMLDETFPLDSGLELTPNPGVDPPSNGLLQAWEILERLRIDADVVVLSGCETALGANLGGEGLIGLVRSFHHAGARAVVASLWKVDDRSTRELMVRFYRGLREGLGPAGALRAAQLELLGGDADGPGAPVGLSHPHRWAAFQLHGDGG